MNICFVQSGGRTVVMQTTPKTMFAELVQKYYAKVDISSMDQPKFIFNSKELKSDSAKTLEDLKLRDGARVDVIIGRTIIGALKSSPINLFIYIK